MNKEDFLVKNASRIRREQEIAEHGKQIWLRKGGVHESHKAYKRSKYKYINIEEELYAEGI